MDLRHMRYFIAVANELHFTRAAETLRIAQPAISRQIKDLEEEIGAPLITRSGRGIALTHAGRVFYERAMVALQAAESAVVETRRAQRGEIGSIAVGFFEQSAYTLLPPILRSYRSKFPDVDIQLRLFTVTEQHQALHRGDTDVALIRSIENIEQSVKVLADFDRHMLYREKFVMAIPENHHFNELESVPLSACAHEMFVGYASMEAPDFHAMLMKVCASHGYAPRMSLEVGQSYTLIGLISAGTGIALVPASMQKMKFEGVLFKPLADELPDVEIYLAWRKGKATPLLSGFINTALELTHGDIRPRDPSFIIT